MDPRSGEVLALSGGYDFFRSQFNRATQALRQPGSSFKPIVYATALDNGFTAASIILDAPIIYEDGSGKTWKPENFEGNDSVFQANILEAGCPASVPAEPQPRICRKSVRKETCPCPLPLIIGVFSALADLTRSGSKRPRICFTWTSWTRNSGRP